MFRLLPIICCGLLLSSGTTAHHAEAGDWPHWRGPARDGHSDEHSGWNNGQWLKEKPLWSVNVGEGSSSPLVIGDQVFVLGWNNNSDRLACLDASTGREQWSVSYRCPRYGRHSTGDKGIYSGPSSTPEYDPRTGLLYTLSIDGDLRCVDTKKRGNLVWAINLYEKYQVPRRPNVGSSRRMLRDYGYTSSPLVHDDWLLVEVGDDNGNLIAFDKRTGAEQWRSECRDPAGHTGGAVPITVEGIPCAVILTIRNLVVVRLDASQAGKTLATVPWTTDFANNIPTPAVHENNVVVTSAYNQYAICRLKITRRGAEKVWQTPEIASGVCSPIIHDGHIYWAWRGVHCLDFATGKQKWAGGNVGTAGSCIVTADDRLIVWANQGELSLYETARRSPDSLNRVAGLGRQFSTDAWPHVVLAHGRLLVKDRLGNLRSFAVGQE